MANNTEVSEAAHPSAFEPPAFQRLDCYVVAKELARRVHVARISDAELRDQATRAAKSCFLTLCEGLPNRLQSMRGKYFTESNNSLAETLGAVDLAAAIGAMNAADAATVTQLGIRLRMMLRKLLGGAQRQQTR